MNVTLRNERTDREKRAHLKLCRQLMRELIKSFSCHEISTTGAFKLKRKHNDKQYFTILITYQIETKR